MFFFAIKTRNPGSQTDRQPGVTVNEGTFHALHAAPDLNSRVARLEDFLALC
jgi:hypothetical protein